MSTTESDENHRQKPGQAGWGGGIALIWLLVWGVAASYFFVRSDVTDPADIARTTPLLPTRVAATPQVQLKPIEQIKAGEQVLSLDPVTGQWAPHRVIHPLTHDYEGDLITIKIPGDTVEATGNHPFWVVQGVNLASRPPPHDVPQVDDRQLALQGQWVEARHLQVGDLLLIRSGKPATVEELASRRAKIKVYNLQVSDVHTYTVGTDGIVVHNKALQVAPIPKQPSSVVNLWEEGARDNLTGGGVYVLRQPESGQILKVGKTSNFFERSADYAALQPTAGKLQMEIFPVQGNLERGAAETALRDRLLSQGEGLFWDGTGKRAAAFGFQPKEWNLRRLVLGIPEFGTEGWSIPMQLP